MKNMFKEFKIAWIASAILLLFATGLYYKDYKPVSADPQEGPVGATTLNRRQGGTGLTDADYAAGAMIWASSSLEKFEVTTIGTSGYCWKVTGATSLGWVDCSTGITGFADSDIPFITLGNMSSLSYERSLAVDTNYLALTDGGANSTYTIGMATGLGIPKLASASDWNTVKHTYITDGNTGWDNTYGFTKLASLSASGAITYNNTTGAFTITTNYGVPLTASTSAWESFYDTPSGRITDGTGLTWSTNTLNVDDVYVLTAGDTMTGPLVGTYASMSNTIEASRASISFYDLPESDGTRLGDCDAAGDTLNWDLATGRFACGTDATGSVASDSIGFGALVRDMVLDMGSSVSFGAFNWEFDLDSTGDFIISDNDVSWMTIHDTSGVSSSRPFEFTNYASASKYYGSDLTPIDCNDLTDKFMYSAGVFSCGTLASTDLPITGTWTTTGDWTLGDGGDGVIINSDTWDVSSLGVMSGLTGITSTGLAQFTNASASGTFEVGVNKFNVLGASGNTTIAGTLGVTLLSTLSNASISAGIEVNTDRFVVTQNRASASANFEFTAWASASKFYGAGLTEIDCNDATDKLYYSAGIFSCGTLADADIPDTLTLTTITGPTSASNNFEVNNLASADWGVFTNKLYIPNGATKTFAAPGSLFLDTTAFELQIASTSANTPRVIPTMQVLWSGSIASTSNEWASGGRLYLGSARDNKYNIQKIYCDVEGGTSVVIGVSNHTGTYDTETVTCSLGGASDTSIDTSSGYGGFTTASSSLEIGTITGAVNWVNFTIYGTYLPQ